VAKKRTKVSEKLIADLKRQVGGKCANPGCSARRTHIHHIREWAVYQTHDEKHMIAVCPSCHDEIHHGQLHIDDDTVYRWKHVPGRPSRRDHIYVEPGRSPKVFAGTMAFTGTTGITIFEVGDGNVVNFRLEDGDIMMLNVLVSTPGGRELLRVVDGHVRHQAADPVNYERVQGHVRLTAPTTDEFVPRWALDQLREEEPGFGASGRMPLLDIEVLEPALIRIQGMWSAPREAVAITLERVALLAPHLQRPISMVGDGVESVIKSVGPITIPLFSNRKYTHGRPIDWRPPGARSG